MIYAGTHEKAPTDFTEIHYRVPADKHERACKYLKKIGAVEVVDEADDSIPWRESELFKESIEKYGEIGPALRGLRYREDLTQVALSKKTGISQHHISEMENGKRTIGKQNARKLAKALNSNYRIFL